MAERLGQEESRRPAFDTEHSPVEEGRDPLGDNASMQAYRRMGQLVLASVAGVVFTILGLLDITSGHGGRGAFALVIAALNAYIAAKEQGKPTRPRS